MGTGHCQDLVPQPSLEKALSFELCTCRCSVSRGEAVCPVLSWEAQQGGRSPSTAERGLPAPPKGWAALGPGGGLCPSPPPTRLTFQFLMSEMPSAWMLS